MINNETQGVDFQYYPSAISIALSLRAEFEVINIIIAIIINIIFVYIILKSSKKIESVLGTSGIKDSQVKY